MSNFLGNHNLFYRPCAILLIVFHLVTFGPTRNAIAFSSQSFNYGLNSVMNEGGMSRDALSASLWQDAIGEPCIGRAESENYILNTGFIPSIQPNPPLLTQKIPYQNWAINTPKDSAFDLDDYFSSPDGFTLTYSVIGNSSIAIVIDPSTHVVSFSQPQDWKGVEKVYFIATDSQNSTVRSKEVILQVANNPGEPNNPVILETTLDPLPTKEGDLVKLTVKAYDLDNEDLAFTYNEFFTETSRQKVGDYWVSQATWQTGAGSNGHYTVKATVSDGALADMRAVMVNIGNFNHAPVLNDIADIVANETDLVVIQPSATDQDNDPIVFYYSAPFDIDGKWLTGYEDEGTYYVTVTAFDGIDTVSKIAKVIINNTNRPPQISLTLTKYTVYPNDSFDIVLSGSDPDGDTMTFSVKKDDTEIASGDFTSTYRSTAAFADLGDHTISATITDSNTAVSTDSKGVDVADPNLDRYSINPVMGDFNGDALTDLGLHNSDTGLWEICLSDKGVFRNAVDWLSGFGTSKDWWPIGGDFNGDAKTDISLYNNKSGELKVALSSGSGFTSSGTWLNFPSASYSWQPFTGNFNADRYTDFGLYNKDSGEARIALGTGSGFGPFTTWLTSNSGNTGHIAMGGDFNGDSLTDLCLFQKSTGQFKIALSNSKEFVDETTWISGYAVDKDAVISDFNNDALTDIGYWDSSSGTWYYAISTGDKFSNKGVWINSFGGNGDDGATAGDFDGNGLTDAACFDRDQGGITRWQVRLSQDKPADLLTEIDNGIGGKTKVVYTYAALSDNSDLPFPVYVATSISSINAIPADRAAAYTHNFTFSGGYFDATEREFRGFARVKISDPITNNYSETFFYQGLPGQDGALKGQIEKILAYDGNGRQISQLISTYDVKKSGPVDRFLGFPALVKQTTTVWEENATYITTEDEMVYDNIGNSILQKDKGITVNNISIPTTGDEKSTTTIFAQAYEAGFNLPLQTTLKDKDGDVVSRKNYEYDAKGNLKKESVWLNTQDTQPCTQYSYDSFGNTISATNSLGSIIVTEYEADFYTFLKKSTNALGQSNQYVYDPKFGVVKSTVDANGNTSNTSYDSLGRPTQSINAYNQIILAYAYPDFNTKTTANAAGLFKTEYIDGLGRKYKSVSSGEDGPSQGNVSSEVFYDSRGLTDKESLPHYVDEATGQISYVRREYDLRGRVKKTISDFPGASYDAESYISYINPLYTESTDPLGHRKGSLKDAYGNILQVTEFTSDGVFKTGYEYDAQNNLVKTTDNQGNITQVFYDSLGRKIGMVDPDMGTWTYEYDLVGNLKKQTDAKGQILEFNYDAVNRLISKSADNQTLVAHIYDDPVKDNCIGRLSKVTDQSGSTEFFYDKLGREIKSIKTIDSTPYTVERTYDTLDRLVSLIYPDSETVTYDYDANSGLLEKVTGNHVYVQDISYNPKGQIKNIIYGNNIHTAYTYSPDLRLSCILTQGLDILQDLNYLFDKNGNIAILTDNKRNNIRSFIYDSMERLIGANNIPNPGSGYSNFSYQYDSIGNMIYRSDVGVMTYGQNAGPHAVTQAGGYNYQYDVNGNMIFSKNKTLSYDAENRLTQVNKSGAITAFIYDGDGGRVKKTDPNGSTIYVGSLFENDPSGKITKYIFAGANRVASIESSGNTYYTHSDHLGSSNVITDQNGQLIQYCEYTPYGTIARNEGADVVSHKFNGKELDNTGLYFYGARYYDPELGRFITSDTIVQAPYDPQSLNRYSYCRNNPLNLIDPTGHSWWKNIFKAIGDFLKGIFDWLGKITGTEWDVNVNAQYTIRFGTGAASAPTYNSGHTFFSHPSSFQVSTVAMPTYSEVYIESFFNGQSDSPDFSSYDDTGSIEAAGDLSASVARSYGKNAIKGIQRFISNLAGGLHKELYKRQWEDLWSNAKYSKLTPALKNIKSGVQGVGLFMGGLSIFEPLSLLNKDSNFSGKHAFTMVAIRALRVSAVAVSTNIGLGLGGFAGGAISGFFTGGVGTPFGFALGAGAGAVLVGGLADGICGAIERRIMRWSGYEEQ